MKTLSLKSALLKDSKKFFELRFSAESRKFSLNKDNIDYLSHLRWYKSKINNKKNIYRTINVDNKIVGYLRLDFIEFYYQVSIFGIKKYQKKGIFTKVIKKIETSLKKPCLLLAKVKNKNINSIIFFKKNNYKLVEKDNRFLTFLKFKKRK